MTPRVTVVLLLALVAIPLWPIALPLGILLGVPALALGGIWFAGRAIVFLSRAAWLHDRPMFRRFSHAAACAALCVGFLLIVIGIAMSIDSALAGDPPTPEQKRLGRTLAYAGAALASAAAIAAFALDPGRGSSVKGKPARAELDDWSA